MPVIIALVWFLTKFSHHAINKYGVSFPHATLPYRFIGGGTVSNTKKATAYDQDAQS
jgi:hypothetical protein